MNTSLPKDLSITSATKTTFAFVLITSLFFFWGFSNNLNPILIPHLKKSFTLTTTQATLVDSAVYIAYFLVALPAGFVMKRFGYKTGIITGLLVFSLGAFLFIPAANAQSYAFFLFALFVIACGLGFLETAANPYAVALGRSETSTQRLNLAQSFNGLAAALAPVIGGKMILAKGYTEEQLSVMPPDVRDVALASEAASVKMPYLILGTVLLLVAVIFAFTKLPTITHQHTGNEKRRNIFHALRHRHLSRAVIAQFFYVGAQVCVFSLFVLYATHAAEIDEVKATYYLGSCGIAFLLGRFFGTFFMKFVKPSKLLVTYAMINILLCMVAMLAHGLITVYSVILICFFMSIIFPTIFALGISELGDDSEYGSSLLIMSIAGGALLPRIYGIITDSTGDVQLGYIVPLTCFAVVAFFGWTGYQPHPLRSDERETNTIAETIV